MKIKIAAQNRGGTMLITLLMAIIIGITLASYLTLVSAQNRAVMRSLAWNSTIPILEAGIEEALTQVKYRGVTNLATDGWNLIATESGPRYFKKRSIGSSFYEVTVTPTDPPVIISTGYELAPLSPVAQVGMILGNVTSGAPAVPEYVKRRVRCNTIRHRYFNHAMLAREDIKLNGNNVMTDSFNSLDPKYSKWLPGALFGLYDPTKNLDNGDVATNSGLTDSLNTGNAKIKGDIATGPYGSAKIGAKGSVGSDQWVDGGTSGIEQGHYSNDMNVDISPVTLPDGTSWSSVSSGNYTVNGTNYNYSLGGGTYKISTLKGKIYVGGNATVYVPYGGSVDLTGSSFVYLAPGATLKVYVGAADAKLSGSGVSNPGSALNFQLWGLDSNTKITFSGNASFTGTIYAPNADFQLNGGGGNSQYDFIGACVTKTIQMNGNFSFHFDEALMQIGPSKGYLLTSWNEISPNP